jgi:hypothetical protein
MNEHPTGFEFGQVPRPEKFLFHYTSLYSVMAILASSEFWFSVFKNTNDPRENKAWDFGIQPTPSNDEIMRIVTEMGAILRESVQLACFTQDKDGTYEDAQFLRGYSRARNWDQYADRHRGACLVFDRDNFEDATRSRVSALSETALVHCGPVKYVDMQSTMFPNGQMLSINTGLLRDLGLNGFAASWIRDHLYFRKNTDWESEREYRVLTLNCTAPIRIPLRPSLLAIVLGAEFPASSEEAISHFVQASGLPDVQIAKMAWRNGAPGASTRWG